MPGRYTTSYGVAWAMTNTGLPVPTSAFTRFSCGLLNCGCHTLYVRATITLLPCDAATAWLIWVGVGDAVLWNSVTCGPKAWIPWATVSTDGRLGGNSAPVTNTFWLEFGASGSMRPWFFSSVMDSRDVRCAS